MGKIKLALADGFDDSEFTVPYKRLREVGHEVTVFCMRAGEVVTGKPGNASHRVETVAVTIAPDDYDALVISGGHSPDKLRLDAGVVAFTRRFFVTGKPVAAICHGPQPLIEAGIAKERNLASWPSVRTDFVNAGANWMDQAIVIDGDLVASRKPDDLSVFCEMILGRLP
jgi:protease I